jgi:branched-chain amino acid transport system substrate-binding protein
VNLRAAAIALVGLVLASTAGAAPAADPGLTSSTVLLGGTVPLTGEAAAFGSVGPGAKAYFDYVNAKGGVNGRTIEYRYYDDAYNPAQTVQLTRRLVEQDKVFAIFNSIGTANNLAIRDYLNAQKVPQLWAGDGSQSIGRSWAKYPWTMGFLMSYRGEGDVYGKTIVKSRPKAKIAVLYENTELGLDMLTGLTRAIAGKGPRIVAKQAYEFTGADVSGQIGLLKASGADTLMLFATPKFFLQAIATTHRLGWRPQVYIASVSIEPTIMGIARFNAPELTKGALSIAFVKNPNDPIWAKDKAVALYRSIMRKYDPSGKQTGRLQLVRHDRRVDDGRDAAQGGEEPDAIEPPEGRTEPRHAREPVPAPRAFGCTTSRTGLPPDGAGLPLSLRQQAVGARERPPPCEGMTRRGFSERVSIERRGGHMKGRIWTAAVGLAAVAALIRGTRRDGRLHVAEARGDADSDRRRRQGVARPERRSDRSRGDPGTCRHPADDDPGSRDGARAGEGDRQGARPRRR